MYIHFDVSGIPETSKFANSKHEHEQGSFILYPLSIAVHSLSPWPFFPA
jgi:hypothetical protein